MISLLLVDDHELFRSSLRRRLESESDLNPVGEAGTAEQAVVKARALQPDMILLDLLLPRTSGYDAIPSLAKVSPGSKVLVISSQAAPSSVRTVDSHRAHIMRKLRLETRAELVLFALANGLIGP